VTVSYWLEEATDPIPRVELRQAPEVEIVGGGVTGCSAALALAEAGLRVRLHDAREIAGGASGRNGGFALRGGAMAYDTARARLGRERAAEYWRFSEHALEQLASLAGDAFERTGSLRLAADDSERDEVSADHAALREDGFEAEWVEELDPPLRGWCHGALLHPRDGALQPARWVRRLAARAAAAGAELREHSCVGSLHDLRAERVLIATDGYTHGLVPQLDGLIRPTRGQVLVTEPLPERVFRCPHYTRRGFDYWQQPPNRRLVLGGRRDVGLEAEWTADEELTERVQEELERLLVELLGSRPEITHRWAGIWGTTADDLPLVGQLPDDERVWVACGYSGHGNVLGFACGELVAKAMLGRAHAQLQLFDPARLA
jgi:gamma-glutamylputrescine oxidase